jgi:hypothetical protein
MLIKLSNKIERDMITKAIDDFIDNHINSSDKPDDNPTFLAAINLRGKMQIYFDNNKDK